MDTARHPAAGRIRLGEFEVDLRSRELVRGDRRLRLQEKSFLVLAALLERPGEVVTRQELEAALWPAGYHVDAEHGLNAAVRRLRRVLGDSADHARYIETLPRLGYRLIDQMRLAPIAGSPPVAPVVVTPPAVPPRGRGHGVAGWGAALAIAVLIALGTMRVVQDFGRLRGATPGSTDVVEELLARSRYLRNVKRPDEARQFVEQALAVAPANPHALAGLSLSLLGAGRPDDAEAMARRALAADARAWEAHRTLGTLARAKGDFAVAERHLRLAAEAGRTDSKSVNSLARHLLEVGRFAEARTWILEARRLAPDDPDVQNIWMEYALRTGDFASAVREGERWLQIWAAQIEGQPTPIVRDMLGFAYLASRRYDDALAQFRIIDPDDDLRTALVHAAGGRAGEARAILDRHEGRGTAGALLGTEDPGHAGSMAMAYVALGDFTRALAHLDRQVDGGLYPGWLNCPLFSAVRAAPGFQAFQQRLDDRFFRGAIGAPVRLGTIVQHWPRPPSARRPTQG